MTLNVKPTSRFKKELRRAVKRGLDEKHLNKIIKLLVNQQPLPPENKDHELKGKFNGYRECHIQNDWLLIYKVYKNELVLSLERTGTHSDLF
ncbi:MAG: type II toxin-antitoxin system YafQ family toxin [Oscillospiraceae bacterium]|nr:type II toxin-antitoxin system YafQ family toxin [Oscillospiraceae bacterium]